MKFSSKNYWEDRYKRNGNSGLGSYGDESIFKSNYINDLIKNKSIKTITDLGCGDGNQISLLNGFEKYFGYDFSTSALVKAKNKNTDNVYEFIDEISVLPVSDISMSLDVTYHIIEDELFNNYLNDLFSKSDKFVLIYSVDEDLTQIVSHVKFRKFTNWVEENKPEFKLISVTKYPNKTNGVGFYLFEK